MTSTNSVSHYQARAARYPTGILLLKPYAVSGDAYATAGSLADNADRLASEDGLLPNVPAKAWETLDDYAWRYDGSDGNTEELNEARAKLGELQEIIDTVNNALRQLPRDYRAQIIRELFGTKDQRQGTAPANEMLSDLFGGDEFVGQVGAVIAAFLARDADTLHSRILGKLEGGDYKPSNISLDDLRDIRMRVETRLYRLSTALGDALVMPVPNSLETTVESFMSNTFSEGVEFDEIVDGVREHKTEHIISRLVDTKIMELEPWINSLGTDKRQRMRSLLARLPNLVDMMNDTLNLAEGSDKSAYIAMFLGSSGKPEYFGDNPDLNAANIGKLVASVLAGDVEALKKFADIEIKKLDEIVLDFIKVEGEFRQTRDITTPDDLAAREYFDNVFAPTLRGELEAEKSEAEKDVEAARQRSLRY